MGRHNEEFPLQHLYGVIIGVSGHGDASAGIRDLSAFFKDARIRLVDAVDVHGTYACFECGFAQACEVAGVWDIFPQDTKMCPPMNPGIDNQDPHLSIEKRRRNMRSRLKSAGETLGKEPGHPK